MDFERLLKFAQLYSEAANHPRADYMRAYMANRYHQKRQEIINRLGGRCSRCGTSEGKFHLDHKDKAKKTMRASDMHSVNDQKFENEIKNLQILCEDCHREKTKEAWDYSTPKPSHGTYWLYRKYRCRCPACVRAYQAKQKEWRKQQRDDRIKAMHKMLSGRP